MSRLPHKASDLGIRRLARQLGETAGAIITDHGSLTGLGDDDHPHYLNNARGDARYDSLGSATNAVAGHVSAADPHPQYLTPAEASAAYAPLAHVGSGGSEHAAATTSVAGFMSAADKTKLDGVAVGATANATDAALRDRATHTGTQAASTISDSTATGRALITAADAAAGRTALGLGNAATSALSTTNAAALGTAAPGSETTVARADHVHPMPTAAQVGAGGLTTANTWAQEQTIARQGIYQVLTPQATIDSTVRAFRWSNDGTLTGPLRLERWNGTVWSVLADYGFNGISLFGNRQFIAYSSGNSFLLSVLDEATGQNRGGIWRSSSGAGGGSTQYVGREFLGGVSINDDGSISIGSSAATATFNGNNMWHAGNCAQVQAGTINGQLATWNNTASRWDAVTASSLINAANDAAAASAGVPVSGVYRNGSALQIRVS